MSTSFFPNPIHQLWWSGSANSFVSEFHWNAILMQLHTEQTHSYCPTKQIWLRIPLKSPHTRSIKCVSFKITCIFCTPLKSPQTQSNTWAYHTPYPLSQCSEPPFYEISAVPDFYKQTRDETATPSIVQCGFTCVKVPYIWSHLKCLVKCYPMLFSGTSWGLQCLIR